MALSRAEANFGINFPARERTDAAPAPIRLTPSEISQIALTVPGELTAEKPVSTVVGTWSIENGVTIFDFKSEEELQKIRIPEPGEKRKQAIIKALKFITQMG